MARADPEARGRGRTRPTPCVETLSTMAWIVSNFGGTARRQRCAPRQTCLTSCLLSAPWGSIVRSDALGGSSAGADIGGLGGRWGETGGLLNRGTRPKPCQTGAAPRLPMAYVPPAVDPVGWTFVSVRFGRTGMCNLRIPLVGWTFVSVRLGRTTG